MISLIIISSGRNTHLLNVMKGLSNGYFDSSTKNEIILVSDDAPDLSYFGYNLHIETPQIAISDNFSYARNFGAKKASGDTLVFLDVDCIPSKEVFHRVSDGINDDTLYMFEPMYLTKKVVETHPLSLSEVTYKSIEIDASYNPYRPRHKTELETDNMGLFWSLGFACCKLSFQKLGGFDENFSGYGAEDTDFAFRAGKCSVKLILLPQKIYHQQHTVYRPPLNHFEDIILNSNYFYTKWGFFPMKGWLEEFKNLDLIEFGDTAITIKSLPTIDMLNSAKEENAPYV